MQRGADKRPEQTTHIHLYETQRPEGRHDRHQLGHGPTAAVHLPARLSWRPPPSHCPSRVGTAAARALRLTHSSRRLWECDVMNSMKTSFKNNPKEGRSKRKNAVLARAAGIPPHCSQTGKAAGVWNNHSAGDQGPGSKAQHPGSRLLLL